MRIPSPTTRVDAEYGGMNTQLPGPSENFERQLDVLRGLIAEDPGRVALVLKRWIMSND